MSWFPAAAALGGGAISALGGMVGASGSRSDQNKARDLQLFTGRNAQQGLGRFLWGDQFGFNKDDLQPGQQKLWSVKYPQSPSSGSLLGRMNGLVGGFDQAMGGIRGQYGRNTANLNRMAGGAEGMASRYGGNAESLIDTETSKAIRNANAMSDARFSASGLGNSTLKGSQASQNAMQGQLAGAEQKNTIRRETLDRTMQARQNRVGLMAGRYSGGENMDLGALQTRLGLQQAPMNLEAQTAMSSLMNPNLGMNMGQFVSPYSAAGTGLNSIGNSLSTIGGYGLANQMYGRQQEAPYQSPQGYTGDGYDQYYPGMNRPH